MDVTSGTTSASKEEGGVCVGEEDRLLNPDGTSIPQSPPGIPGTSGESPGKLSNVSMPVSDMLSLSMYRCALFYSFMWLPLVRGLTLGYFAFLVMYVAL